MTTFAELAASYQSDADSPYRTVEHASRIQYAKLCKRLTADKGDVLVSTTAARDLRRWHQEWTMAPDIGGAGWWYACPNCSDDDMKDAWSFLRKRRVVNT